MTPSYQVEHMENVALMAVPAAREMELVGADQKDMITEVLKM